MNVNDQQKASRRGFLGTVVSGAAALGLAAVAGSIKAAPVTNSSFTNSKGIEEWFRKIKGKHKIVFDAPEFNEGMPLAFPRVFQITNNNAGVPTGDLGIVIVLRHNALPLALNSQLWAKYNLGEIFKINDPAINAPSKRNFLWEPNPGELELPGMSIKDLKNSGVLFCVCEMAILHYSMLAAKKAGLDHETVRKEWTAGILPGVQPVPSGVFAVNRAQEQGCTYCFAG